MKLMFVHFCHADCHVGTFSNDVCVVNRKNFKHMHTSYITTIQICKGNQQHQCFKTSRHVPQNKQMAI